MRNKKGQFIKGQHYSPKTEFKKGQHWRKKQLYWNKEWLYNEYIVKGKSAADIAKKFGCWDRNIIYFLHKYSIPVRSVSEARKKKYWGLVGEKNGMFGKRGAEVPSWKGGITPERQAFYSSLEWSRVQQKVWARDKSICQYCGLKYTKASKKNNKQGRTGFHIHHIVDFSVKELRLKLGNLVLLCWTCHRWVHSRKNKKQLWIKKI